MFKKMQIHCIFYQYYAKIDTGVKIRKEVILMNEKLYKVMNATAISSLVLGICMITTGITFGTLLIVNGARLLKHKSRILL